MKLLIRADANREIGVGHVMRMIALAQAWIDLGGEATICSVECSDPVVARIQSEGIRHVFLASENIGSHLDSIELSSLASSMGAMWVVLDGYAFDFNYQKVVRENGSKLLWVDDCHFEGRVSADVLLNQNLGIKNHDYLEVGEETRMLLGTDYCLLRREFLDVCLPFRCDESGLTKVLVTFGGSDPVNATCSVLKSILSLDLKSHSVRVLIGSEYGQKDELLQIAANACCPVVILEDTKDMPAQYAWANTVISAVGGSTWEWLRYGHHAAIIPLVENQELLSKELVSENLATQIGTVFSGRVVVDQQKLGEWFNGLKLGNKDSATLVDGRGARRVCSFLLG